MKKLLVLFALVLTCLTSALADESIPKDALWTIYCRSFSGPMHVQESKRVKDALAKTTGMKHWHVIHSEEESTLYYGFYRAVSPDVEESGLRKDAQRAREDLRKIKELQDANKERAFSLVGFVPLPQPGSEGPPEWDLRNTPQDMYWTLYVGVYRDNPDRKKAAVEAVRILREDGIPAYYYHDVAASLVCIGTWPREAIREQQSTDASVNVQERDVEVMAVNVPLPDNFPREFQTPEGKKVRVFAPKIEVADPTLQRAMDRYPDFLTNGKWLGREVKDPVTGKTKVIGHSSQLLIIPRKDKGDDENRRAVERAVRHLQPSRPAQTGGRLRSLEE